MHLNLSLLLKYMFFRLHYKGITLIEVLIAAGVLALILGSTVALGRSVTRNQIITQDRAQALALTVEAAEIIRNLRDSTYVDQTQNRFNDFLASTGCVAKMCENLEITWDGSAQVNNWFIENQINNITSTLNEGDNLINIESDDDPLGEVIAVNIQTGDISDNTSRVETNKFKDASCSSAVSGNLIFCRKITLIPLVYDNDNDPNTSYIAGNDPNTSYITGTDQINLPPITEEDPASRGNTTGEVTEYIFDAYTNSSFKIISQISWNEFGTARSVESTDIITNWR